MIPILKELARSSVDKNKRESHAIRITIFLSVLVLGAYVSSLFLNWQQSLMVEREGYGYHIDLQDVSQEMITVLQSDNQKIEKLSQVEEIRKTPGDLAYHVKIRLRNIRDTYAYCRSFLSRFNLEESHLLRDRKLIYNIPLLERYGVFPNGFIPSMETLLTFIGYIILVLILIFLFSFMLSLVFLQWMREKCNELALLQSIGMESKSLNKYLLWRSFYLSRVPVLAGICGAFLINIGMNLYVWRFTERSYRAFNWENPTAYRLLLPSAFPFVLLFLLSTLCIGQATYWSCQGITKMTIVDMIRTSLHSQKIKKHPFSFLPVKRVEAGFAQLFRSYYRNRERKLFLILALLSVFICFYVLREARNELMNNHPARSSYLVELRFWTDEALPGDLKQELMVMRDTQKIQLEETEADKIYITIKAERKDAVEAATLERLLRDTVEKYLDYSHWVGLGSLQENVLNQTATLTFEIRLSIWYWVMLLFGATLIFQNFLNLFLSRKGEFICLQACGMTTVQLRKTLLWEILYVLAKTLIIILGEFVLLGLLFSVWSARRFTLSDLWKQVNLLPLILYIGAIIFNVFLALYIALRNMREMQEKPFHFLDGF